MANKINPLVTPCFEFEFEFVWDFQYIPSKS